MRFTVTLCLPFTLHRDLQITDTIQIQIDYLMAGCWAIVGGLPIVYIDDSYVDLPSLEKETVHPTPRKQDHEFTIIDLGSRCLLLLYTY